MNSLYAACIIYFLGMLTAIFPKSKEMIAHYSASITSLIGSVITFCLAVSYLYSNDTKELFHNSLGFFSLSCDRWGAVFLAIIGLVGAIAAIYAWGYAKDYLGKRLRLLGSLWNGFLLSMVMVVVAADVFSFLFAWEVMAVISFLLVNHEAEKKETHNAAFQFLVMTHIGTSFIMVAFLFLAINATSLSFSSL